MAAHTPPARWSRANPLHSDSELQGRITRQYQELRENILAGLRQWRTTRSKSMGLEVLTADERRGVRQEVERGVEWLRSLDRAIGLNRPEAAAVCAFTVAEIFAGLNKRVDLLGIYNRIVPDSHRGVKLKSDSVKRAKAANASRRRKSKARTQKARELFEKELPRRTSLRDADETVAGILDISPSFVRKATQGIRTQKKIKKVRTTLTP